MIDFIFSDSKKAQICVAGWDSPDVMVDEDVQVVIFGKLKCRYVVIVVNNK